MGTAIFFLYSRLVADLGAHQCCCCIISQQECDAFPLSLFLSLSPSLGHVFLALAHLISSQWATTATISITITTDCPCLCCSTCCSRRVFALGRQSLTAFSVSLAKFGISNCEKRKREREMQTLMVPVWFSWISNDKQTNRQKKADGTSWWSPGVNTIRKVSMVSTKISERVKWKWVCVCVCVCVCRQSIGNTCKVCVCAAKWPLVKRITREKGEKMRKRENGTLQRPTDCFAFCQSIPSGEFPRINFLGCAFSAVTIFCCS